MHHIINTHNNIIIIIVINIIIILFILFGEIVLKKLSYKNLSHPLDEDINRRLIIQLEYNSNIKDSINEEITNFEKKIRYKNQII